MENLYSKLKEKINKEYNNWISEIANLSVNEVIDKADEIVLRKKLLDLYNDGFGDYKFSLKLLLEKDNALNFLYNECKEIPNKFYFDFIDKTGEALEESVIDYENKLFEKIEKDPNYKFMENVTITLNMLDKLDLTVTLKEKLNTKDLDIITVYDILNNYYDVIELYKFFGKIQYNEQVKYLVKNHIIPAEKMDNIRENIFPKLKEIINNQEKSNKINKKKFEREER